MTAAHFVSVLLENTVLAGGLALMVLALSRPLRNRPAVLHVLWLVVLLKLVTPPLVSWPTDMMTVAAPIDVAIEEPVEQAYAAPAPEKVPSAIMATPTAAAPALNEAVKPTSVSAKPAPVSIPAPTASWQYAGHFTFEKLAWLLAAFWAGGAIVTSLIQARRALPLLKQTRTAQQPPGWLRETTAALARRLGVKPPDTRVSSEVSSAFIWGFMRPRLLVSEVLVNRLNATQWEPVIAHELAHLKRRDHWTGWLELVVLCVHWWNPVCWLARRQLRENAELACDALVVNALPSSRRSYAETLIDVAAMISKEPAPAYALGIGISPRISFERRLAMILHGKPETKVPRIAIAGTVLLALLVAPSWSQEAETPAPETPPPAAAAGAPAAPEPLPPAPEKPQAEPVKRSVVTREDVLDKMKAPVSVEFENEHIATITQFLSEYTGVNIVIDWTTVAAPPKPLPPQKPVSFNPGAEVKAPYVTNGVVSYVNLQGLPLEAVLEALLKPLSLQYRLEQGFIWVSDEVHLGAESFGDAKPGPQPELESLLDAPVSIQFENEHISNIMEFISGYVGVNIVLDSRVIQPPEMSARTPVRRNIPTRVPSRSNDGMVPYVNLKNVPLGEVLGAITRGLNLDYVVQEGFVWIGYREQVDNPAYFTSPPTPPDVADPDMLSALKMPLSIQFEDTKVGQILAFIADYHNINIFLDPVAMEYTNLEDGTVPRIDLRNVETEEGLKALLRSAGLYYRIEPNMIRVGLPDMLKETGI